MACAPPIWNTFATLSSDAVPKTSATGRGEATQIFATPATCAGTTVIRMVEGSG